jgi:DNA-binding beta-propeller fold protein YncE
MSLAAMILATMVVMTIAALLLFSAVDWNTVPQLPHKLVTDWAKLPAGWNFGEVPGVAVDGQDNVWVFHRGKNAVIQFDKSGKVLKHWSDVPVISAHGIKIGPDGAVWLVDVGGHAVMKFNQDGRLQMVIANSGRTPGNNESRYAFNRPAGLGFKPDGSVYVADGYGNSRVIEFTAAGEFVRQWGKPGSGPGEFNLVHDVTMDKRGRVYVGDRTNARIQVFDQQGMLLEKWEGIGQPWGLVYSAAEDALYMCDGENNRLVKLSMDGRVVGQLGKFGKAPGRFDYPHYLAVDSEGSIYVAEIKNWRVQKFSR